MVEQFGFAIILSSFVMLSALISGTTNFFVASIRQAEELSITTVPTSANFGAHSKEVYPPAENNAMVGFFETASSKPITLWIFPLNSISFPTDFSEATTNNSVIGKFRSANTCSMMFPTIPVAPTTATFIRIKFVDLLYKTSLRLDILVAKVVNCHKFNNEIEMIIIYKKTKQFKYTYVYRRDYRKFEDAFLINTIVALDYLYENDILLVNYKARFSKEQNEDIHVNIIDVLVDETKEPVFIRQFHKNQYQPATNTIFFNDTQGATFRKNYRKRFTPDNKGYNSPLALFAHEIIHCYHELYDLENYNKRRQNKSTKGRKVVPSGADLSYPNKEEELVILLTNQVVKKLGEDIRTNYGRNYYDVDNVLSTRERIV